MPESEQPTVVSWAEARAAEFKLIHGSQPDLSGDAYARQTQAMRQSALCLSGGGIRSAAFCLGVLQALGRSGTLAQFHYLSTVSGGGYIGSWLQVLLQTEGMTGAMARLEDESSPQLRWLRRFTNYLTPSTGLLSTDAWTGIMLYLRNLFLNWVVFLPLFLLFTIVAIFARTAFAELYRPALTDACHLTPFTGGSLLESGWSANLAPCDGGGLLTSLGWWESASSVLLGFVAAAALLSAVLSGARLLPSHRYNESYATETKIFWYCVFPGLVWAGLTPLATAPWFEAMTAGSPLQQLALPFVFWCLSVLGFVLAARESLGYAWTWLIWAACLGSMAAGLLLGVSGLLPWVWAAVGGAALFALLAFVFAVWDARSELPLGAYVCNLWPWICAAAGSACVLWLGLRLGRLVEVDRRAEVVAVLGPFWLVMCHTIMSAGFVGLRRETSHAELDREWLGRLSAMKLRIAAMWAVFAAATLILSRIGLHEDRAWRPLLSAVAAGPIAAWLGKQAMSQLQSLVGGKALALSWAVMLNVMAAVFGIAVAAWLGLLADNLLGLLQTVLQIEFTKTSGGRISWLLMFAAQAVLVTLLLLIHWRNAVRINVNRFSMHGVYRNRLIRAFLRGARPTALFDPFTKFDDADNPKLHELRELPGDEKRRLFPVLGMTLNLTGIGRQDWAERKGASFTATPTHCGAGYARDTVGAYVDSKLYAWRDADSKHRAPLTGISLGTAMTISGAAVSPNWGYHSSPLAAFLMTLFNARLGAWLPNPVKPDPTGLDLAKPQNVFQALFAELLGNANDEQQAIYLSDGGHFDNLGLYEMLRRRCALILVVDVGADPDCKLHDLGAALRRAEIDMGVAVEFSGRLASRTARKDDTNGTGIGTITYKEGTTGILLYLKPDYPADLPITIRAYGDEHPTFPHESTLEQWFTESQFESYRALGDHQATQLLQKLGAALGTALDPALDAASAWSVKAAALQAALQGNG